MSAFLVWTFMNQLLCGQAGWASNVIYDGYEHDKGDFVEN